MAFELEAFADRESRNADAAQAEVVGAVIVPRLWMRVGLYGEVELFSDFFHFRIKRRSLRAADFHFFGNTDGRKRVVIQINDRLRGQLVEMLAQIFGAEQAL